MYIFYLCIFILRVIENSDVAYMYTQHSDKLFSYTDTDIKHCNTNSLINHANKYSNGDTHDHTTKTNAVGIHYHNQAHLPKPRASGGDEAHEEEDDDTPYHLHIHLALQLGPLVSRPTIVQHCLCLTAWWLWEREGGQVFTVLK